MSVPRSADNAPLVSRNAANTAIGSALGLYVGRGRRYSVKQLSNATGVPDRRIECALVDPDSNDFRALAPEHLLSLCAFLGAEFTSEWLGKAGQGAFDLPDSDDPRPGDLALAASEDTTEIVRRAADGEFCADDRQALKVVGQRKMANGAKLIAMARRAA